MMYSLQTTVSSSRTRSWLTILTAEKWFGFGKLTRQEEVVVSLTFETLFQARWPETLLLFAEFCSKFRILRLKPASHSKLLKLFGSSRTKCVVQKVAQFTKMSPKLYPCSFLSNWTALTSVFLLTMSLLSIKYNLLKYNKSIWVHFLKNCLTFGLFGRNIFSPRLNHLLTSITLRIPRWS